MVVDMEIKLIVLSDVLKCLGNPLIWRLEKRLIPISQIEDEEVFYSDLFELGKIREKAEKYGRQAERPALISDIFGLSWMISPVYKEGISKDIYVLGPVFHDSVSNNDISKLLFDIGVPLTIRSRVKKALINVPDISVVNFTQCAIMLHYCLTGENVSQWEIMFSDSAIRSARKVQENDITLTEHGSYAYEVKRFQAVAEGNINYIPAPFTGQVGQMAVGNSVRQAKNEMISMITLATRAAIKGGLLEDLAYTLSDRAIQLLEKCNRVNDVYAVGENLVNDLTERVHSVKLEMGISKEIQKCTSYIEMHLTCKIDINKMAQEIGLSRNYLATKFKREIGTTINDYILSKKIEYAGLKLRHEKTTVEDLAEELSFCSASHFCATFKKYKSMTPLEYINKKDDR